MICLLLSSFLSGEGYSVCTARDGADGLRVFKEESPDLVVTDLRMPGMNGVELARRLSEDAPQLRVLFMTGFPGDAQPEGVADVPVLIKPFGATELAQAVRDRLDEPG